MSNTMKLKKYIGEIVKNRRKELNMTQADLQDYADVGPTTLSNLENGEVNITIDKLGEILDTLGLDLKLEIKEKV